jgi:hypothetical protein
MTAAVPLPSYSNSMFDTSSGTDASVEDAMAEAKKMNNKAQVSMLQTQTEQQVRQTAMAKADAQVSLTNKVGQIAGKVQL